MLKQKRKTLLTRAVLSLFVLGSAGGVAAAMQSNCPEPLLPAQAIVSVEQMKAPASDSGMAGVSGSAVVTASYINVRSGPGVSYSVQGILKSGDVVTLLGKFSNSWYKIKYNNKTGYVTGMYLKISSGEGSSSTGVDKGMSSFNGEGVTTTELNVRSGPSTAYTQIGKLPKGTKATLVGKFSNGWYKIKYANGYAYVSGVYLNVSSGGSSSTGVDKGMSAFNGEGVTTTALNVRSGPSTAYTQIGKLPSGTKVTLVGKFATGWYKIKYANGYAYVSGVYLNVSSGGSSSPEADKGMSTFNGEGVTTTALNVRSGPSTSYTQIGKLPSGTKVTLVGKFATGWYKIKYENGYAYVSGSYLSSVTVSGGNADADKGMIAYNAQGTVKTRLNVRSGPSTSYTKIGDLPQGTKVTAVGKFSNGWYKIKYNSGYAYVCGDYVKIESTGSGGTNPNLDKGMTDFTSNGKTTEDLNVRAGTSTAYQKIGVIPKGTTVSIIGKFPNGWYKIKYGSGYAYVCGLYVELFLPQNPLDDILWIPAQKPLSADYVPAGLVDLKNAYGLPSDGTQRMVKEAAENYYKLYQAAKAAGVLKKGDMVANSAYRSYAEQKQLYNNMPNKQQVSKPGSSEHQLGGVIDIAQKNYYTFKNSPLYVWLKDNSYKYGFVLRYPADKTAITGIVEEPWHYRYVGKEHAKAIYNSGKCLEEYVAAIKK